MRLRCCWYTKTLLHKWQRISDLYIYFINKMLLKKRKFSLNISLILWLNSLWACISFLLSFLCYMKMKHFRMGQKAVRKLAFMTLKTWKRRGLKIIFSNQQFGYFDRTFAQMHDKSAMETARKLAKKFQRPNFLKDMFKQKLFAIVCIIYPRFF